MDRPRSIRIRDRRHVEWSEWLECWMHLPGLRIHARIFMHRHWARSLLGWVTVCLLIGKPPRYVPSHTFTYLLITPNDQYFGDWPVKVLYSRFARFALLFCFCPALPRLYLLTMPRTQNWLQMGKPNQTDATWWVPDSRSNFNTSNSTRKSARWCWSLKNVLFCY